MTDAVSEYMVVVFTGLASGSLLTLLTCWAAGLFDCRSQSADVDAFTAGVMHALKTQQTAFDEAEYTEHSPQLGA